MINRHEKMIAAENSPLLLRRATPGTPKEVRAGPIPMSLLRETPVGSPGRSRYAFPDNTSTYCDLNEAEDEADCSESSDSTSSNESESAGTQIWVPPANLRGRLQHIPANVIVTNDLPESVSVECVPSSCSSNATKHYSTSPNIAPDSGISNESPATPTDTDVSVRGTSTTRFSHSKYMSPMIRNPPPTIPASPAMYHQCAQPQYFYQQSFQRDVTNATKPTNDFKTSLFAGLSGLYGIILIVLGIVLPIAEVFTKKENKLFFEAFYLYLYAASMLFLFYVYVYLLRNKTTHRYKWRMFVRPTEGGLRGASTLEKGQKVSRIQDNAPMGSFYLRLGAVVFGIGSMIEDGLLFAGMLEKGVFSPCIGTIAATKLILHLLFTFVQLYFIFLNAKMSIHKFKEFAFFGLMHMIATNICIWLHLLISETIIQIESAHREPDDGDLPANITGSDMPVGTSTTVEPGILYTMWRNIGKGQSTIRFLQTPKDDAPQRNRVDCDQATRGFFIGIFVFVGAVISIIVFFVLKNKPQFTFAAVLTIYLSEGMLYIFMSLAVVLAFIYMQDLSFSTSKKHGLDEPLLIISQTGVYCYSVFSVVSGLNKIQSNGGLLIAAVHILIIFQSTLQTAFLLNGLRRFSLTAVQHNKKPGRQLVTFLLMCNAALFAVMLFENEKTKTNPIQLKFYKLLTWNIVTHLTIPLIILYRFHSTVCMVNIWKNAYRVHTD